MEKFIIIDKKTKKPRIVYNHNLKKKVVQGSNNHTVAREILSSMNFGLNLYYEVYDTINNVVGSAVDFINKHIIERSQHEKYKN